MITVQVHVVKLKSHEFLNYINISFIFLTSMNSLHFKTLQLGTTNMPIIYTSTCDLVLEYYPTFIKIINLFNLTV